MPTSNAQQRRLYGLVWLFVFAATCFSSGHNPKPGDAKLMCMAAHSLMTKGSLAIEPVRADVARGPDGLYYTKYPLLCVVQCVPAWWLRAAVRALVPNDEPLALWALALVPHALSATLALGVLQLALALGASMTSGSWLALLVIFTTPLWTSGRALYSEVLQALLMVYITLLALRARDVERRSPFVWCGVLCGLALNTKIVLAIMPFAIVVDQLHERLDRKRMQCWLWALPGALIGAGVWLAYNQQRFGNAFEAGYAAQRDAALGFSVPLWSGVYGLLFSSGKSMFVYAPILVASLLVLPSWWRARRRDLILLTIPTLFTLAVTARWWAWNGDWAWGPRLVVPVMPLVAMPLVLLLDQAGKWRRAGIALLAVAGFYVQLLGVIVDPGRFLQVVHPVTESVAGRHDPELLRDDLLPVHFVPELNPILGQQWLLTRYLTQPGWTEASEYPWKSLGIPSWRPRGDPTPERLDFWLDGSASKTDIALECALGIATCIAGALLLRALKRS